MAGESERQGSAGTAIAFMVVMVVTPTIQVASIGIQDSIFLMLLALVVFGPRRLPEIGRQIGKLMYEFRKVSNDFKFQMEEELRASEEAERQRKLQASLPPSTAPDAPPATIDIPPQPVSIAETVEEPAGPVAPAAADENAAAALPGEVGGEPRRFPPAPPEPIAPQIQPPSTGEPVAAARPFRSSVTDTSTVTESGSEPLHEANSPVVVADEGRIGTEVQPGVPAETEVRHG
jgi:sec-independent protein translocase protein TatB